MFKNALIKNEKGFNLVELVVVMSVIAIISAAAVPAYNDFVVNSRVREAANDILQNMKTIRTMAIRDNRPYVMVFNVAANTYTIGLDSTTPPDGVPDSYRGAAPLTVDLQDYGANIVFGSTPVNGPDDLDACGCMPLNGTSVSFAGGTTQTFLPDGTIQQMGGYVTVTHLQRLYTYMVRTFYRMGKIDLWRWDGNLGVPAPPTVTACGPLDSPKRACAWTEIR